MTLARREFLALIGGTAITVSTPWEHTRVNAKAWSLEDFAENGPFWRPAKDVFSPLTPKYVAATRQDNSYKRMLSFSE